MEVSVTEIDVERPNANQRCFQAVVGDGQAMGIHRSNIPVQVARLDRWSWHLRLMLASRLSNITSNSAAAVAPDTASTIDN